jgi:hypothetical protein
VADVARFEQIRKGGCVACWLGGYWSRATSVAIEIHHLKKGNKRIGHSSTVGLCRWHHQSISDEGSTKSQMTKLFGPSLADGSKPFHEIFGDDQFLLGAQNAIIEVSSMAQMLHDDP